MSKHCCVLLAVVLLAGCSGKKDKDGDPGSPTPGADVKRKAQMRDIGLAYHEYFADSNKAPKKAGDLDPYLKGGDANALLKSGDVVFIWDVTPLDMGNTGGSGNTIVAYEKDAPTKGGVVLFGDGAVKHLSAEEFKKSPQAKK
jgi:hypothetical protein